MKVYTRTGDQGKTSLYDGTRVPKNSARVESYGTVDELNSQLGFARNILDDDRAARIIFRVQRELFDVAGELATSDPEEFPEKIGEAEVEQLESDIDSFLDSMNKKEKSRFIVPGSSQASAALHVARTICRRAERRTITLTGEAEIREVILKYLNRLSDLIYTLARYTEVKLDYVEFDREE